MKNTYFATRGRNIVGPFDSRQEALDAFRNAYPHKGADYLAKAKSAQILTGYGADGPYFDMRWHDAKDLKR